MTAHDSAPKQEDHIPSCLLPNTKKTADLVKNVLQAKPKVSSSMKSLLPLPIINVGMPKCGSSTLFQFFKCAGFHATHQQMNRPLGDFEATCMRNAVDNDLPPLDTCGRTNKGHITEALMQIDYENHARGNGNTCFMPQLSLLEELHAENPKITFVMNFRPVHDWIHSITNWSNLLKRMSLCEFPNMPRGVPKHVKNSTEVFDAMAEFLCSHVQHVRNFVEAHPSHALIELDLYDTEVSIDTLAALFPGTSNTSSKCWSVANASRKKKKPNM